ncbi:MAG: DUF5702 domain-containing protein [Clostridium sp.]
MREQNGEITVFLSLILTCICALLGGLLKSARVAGSGQYLQMAANSSLDSLMSKYHREVWENYHIFLLEFKDEEGLAKELEPYFNEYLEKESSYHLKNEDIKVLPITKITDQNGKFLEQEIAEYMKLGIWTMERNPEKLKSLRDSVGEAEHLGEITARYRVDTQDVFRLERALEQIGKCLKNQKESLETAEQKLKECDGSGFISTAKKLEKELKEIPGLIKNYQKEAEELAKEMERSKAYTEENRGNLTLDTWQMLSGELNAYGTYMNQEEERRKTVEKVGEQALENSLIVKTAIEEAEDVQDYIDAWDSDDEEENENGDSGDELDEDALWQSVLHTVSRFQVDHSFKEPEIKDKQTMNVLETIRNITGNHLLSYVVPADKEVSASSINQSSFPSVTEASMVIESDVGIVENLLHTALINEYAGHYFTNFLSDEERELKYEQEYILSGLASDRENLKSVVNRIVKIREAMNLMDLLKNPEKRHEAEALASIITGASGIAPLTGIVSFFILTVWAFGEALEDMKVLLNGGSVPFVKRGEDWNLSLSQLLKTGENKGRNDTGTNENNQNSDGMNYRSYLKLLFMMQNKRDKNLRMMDMIQKNIEKKQTGFRMAQCAFRVESEFRVEGSSLSLKRKSVKAY